MTLQTLYVLHLRNLLLLSIEKQIRPQSFSTWFRPAKARQFSQDALELEVPSAIISDWIENNYLDLIKRVIKEETGFSTRVSFSITANELDPQRSTTGEALTPANTPPSQVTSGADTSPIQPISVLQGSMNEADEWSTNVLFTPLKHV